MANANFILTTPRKLAESLEYYTTFFNFINFYTWSFYWAVTLTSTDMINTYFDRISATKFNILFTLKVSTTGCPPLGGVLYSNFHIIQHLVLCYFKVGFPLEDFFELFVS